MVGDRVQLPPDHRQGSVQPVLRFPEPSVRPSSGRLPSAEKRGEGEEANLEEERSQFERGRGRGVEEKEERRGRRGGGGEEKEERRRRKRRGEGGEEKKEKEEEKEEGFQQIESISAHGKSDPMSFGRLLASGYSREISAPSLDIPSAWLSGWMLQLCASGEPSCPTPWLLTSFPSS